MAALGGLSLGAEFLLLLPPPKKRLKLRPRLRFFSSTGGGAGEGVLPLPPPPYPFAFSALLLLSSDNATRGVEMMEDRRQETGRSLRRSESDSGFGRPATVEA